MDEDETTDTMQPPTDPYEQQSQMEPRPKPTVNGMMLDRMDEQRVELMNLDETLGIANVNLVNLRTDLAQAITSVTFTVKTAWILAGIALALDVVLLMAVLFLFGAMR